VRASRSSGGGGGDGAGDDDGGGGGWGYGHPSSELSSSGGYTVRKRWAISRTSCTIS
jgi:hypothetical protein